MCANTNLRRLGESELNRRGAGKHTRRGEGETEVERKARKTQGDKTSWWGGKDKERTASRALLDGVMHRQVERKNAVE